MNTNLVNNEGGLSDKRETAALNCELNWEANEQSPEFWRQQALNGDFLATVLGLPEPK